MTTYTESPVESSLQGPEPSSLDSYGYKSLERGNPEYLGDHARKLTGRFTPMKRRARAMARYIAERVKSLPQGSIERGQLESLERDVRLCRNHLLFRNHYTEQRVTLSKMKSCKRARLCPLCGVARANGYVATYHKKTRQLEREARAQGIELRAYFVTLTKKHGVDLDKTYGDFSQSVTRLVNRRRAAMFALANPENVKYQSARGSVMASVSAGVFSFEVKRGSGSGLWNVHTHGLLLSTEPIEPARLSEEWHKLTGDSYIVDVQEVGIDDVKALCEVLKYSLKFSEMTLADNYEAATTLQGERFLRSFGGYLGLKPDDTTDIDDTTVLYSPYVEMLYSYRAGSYVRIPTDGTTIVPTSYKRDLTPMMLRQYDPDFVPGIVVGEYAITARAPLTFEVDSSA